jgi:exopolyphosphatase/pppGpp-phosphohydrolase
MCLRTGTISDERAEKFVTTIKAYKHLLDVYEVEHLITAATSAMRDATNAAEIHQRVSKPKPALISGLFPARKKPPIFTKITLPTR